MWRVSFPDEPHGDFSTTPVKAPPQSMADCVYGTRLTFNTMHTKVHDPCAFSKPRGLNRRKLTLPRYTRLVPPTARCVAGVACALPPLPCACLREVLSRLRRRAALAHLAQGDATVHAAIL